MPSADKLEVELFIVVAQGAPSIVGFIAVPAPGNSAGASVRSIPVCAAVAQA